jgi:hypothetical protein
LKGERNLQIGGLEMEERCHSCGAMNHDSLIELLFLISIASKKAAKQLIADDLTEEKMEVRDHVKNQRVK